MSNNDSKNINKTNNQNSSVDVNQLLKNAIGQKSKDIKDMQTINMGTFFGSIDKMTDKSLSSLSSALNSNGYKLGLDKNAIKFISENKDNKRLMEFLSSINSNIDIDINSMAELSAEQFENIREHCNVGKVYVNSGWDVAAKRGYNANTYEKIRTNADKMLKYALSKVPENASKQDKVTAIYDTVLKNTKYDYAALKVSDKSDKFYAADSLEGFFVNGTSICGGTALAFKNLCECEGIDAEYVQGTVNVGGKREYHAWTKVKLDDGKWYNADPTFDANSKINKHKYFLKSDKELKDRKVDQNYNPTYSRGSSVKRNYETKKTYHKSRKSVNNRNIRELGIYNGNRNINTNHQTISESKRKYLYDNKIPAKVESRPTSLIAMFFEWIISKIAGLGKRKDDVMEKANKKRAESIKAGATNEEAENKFRESIEIDIKKIKQERQNEEDEKNKNTKNKDNKNVGKDRA